MEAARSLHDGCTAIVQRPGMKGASFIRRLGYAVAGLGRVARSEASFRSQLCVGALAGLGLVALHASAVWVSLFVLATGLVLAAEAFNAALEYLADALHPEHHPLVGAAKDAAAGAVLIASLTALGVGGAAVYSAFA